MKIFGALCAAAALFALLFSTEPAIAMGSQRSSNDQPKHVLSGQNRNVRAGRGLGLQAYV
jgi:hypothetical protein